MNHKPVEFCSHFDLAAQARIGTHIKSEIEHVIFHAFRFRQKRFPFLFDLDLAGGAGAGAATLSLNAGNGIFHRRFHDARALAHGNRARLSGLVDESDLKHAATLAAKSRAFD
jgi:hypothetical protein